MIQAESRIEKRPRTFLPGDFTVRNWEELQPYFESLLEREIPALRELEQWLRDLSELESVVGEDAAWRQIRMTCDTTDPKRVEAFQDFCLHIQPQLQEYGDRLNRKLLACPFVEDLDQSLYFTFLRSVRNTVELFREANIPLQAELSVMQQQYGQVAGAMTIRVQGREYTLAQAALFLEEPGRPLREEVFRETARRRLQDRETLDMLFSSLVTRRHQLALNAGFEDYRDFRFRELGRFDYTREDCFRFHQAVRDHILPLVHDILERQRIKLGLDELRPWDTEAEAEGTRPLHPFEQGSELLEKSIRCLSRLRPFFGDCLHEMQVRGHLDLDSRKGKAPGGYNCPLAESGIPFIFMNAAGQMKDVTTMVHEGGHAIHSFLTHPLPLAAFREFPMEIAELASMSMELFSMDSWDEFFPDPEELRRARLQQLERVLVLFPWIVIVDAFQHWIYEHPSHSPAQRTEAWLETLDRYSPSGVNWAGWEDYRAISWQRQLHLFEVPFYYIEYGIAQLGAIALWKNFREDRERTLDQYMQALSLGYTRPLKELYHTAGIAFDFSTSYIQGLISFVHQEWYGLLPTDSGS